MKYSASSIPLTVFAGAATGLIGAAFCAGPLSVLGYNVRVHGLYSFVPLMGLTVACIGATVIVLSVAVMMRRRWAYRSLIRLMFALLLVMILALARKLLDRDRASYDHLNDLTFGPLLVLVVSVALLFLINRRVQSDLQPEPKRSSDTAAPGGYGAS